MNWQEVDIAIQTLASKCNNPTDIITGIVRGGLIPSRLLAKYLSVKDMYCLTVAKQGNERLVTSEIKTGVAGKNILLVEDVLESGKSLIVAKEYLENLGAIVETASIFFQTQAQIKPDYYIAERNEVPIFPWD